MKKILIVGAGLSGSVLAERFANVLDRTVVVIDKRNHIGGNCYDFYNEDGVLIPKYGPHFFHTNLEDVWDYINKFSKWIPYKHKVLSSVDGVLKVPIPVNINTINILFNLNLKDERGMIRWLNENTLNINNPTNSEESALNRVGKGLYDLLFKNYTKKQWDIYPKELDCGVLERIPINIGFDNYYFQDKYQAMPLHGYTFFIKNMLNHQKISLELNTDFEKYKKRLDEFEAIFFTGRIDSFFNESNIEKLQYRSLNFEFKTLDMEFFQETAQVNYPNTELFTRITEPKHATGQKHDKTTIIYETSCSYGEPYYPIPTERNKKIYEQYRQEAKRSENEKIFFIGRLAEYKYYNMDECIKNALSLFDKTRNILNYE